MSQIPFMVVTIGKQSMEGIFMYKRVKNVIVAVVLCASVITLPVSASEPQEAEIGGIQLMSVDTRKNTVTLSISKGKAVCGTKVIARSSKLIKVNMYLQKYSSGKWKTIESWSGSKTGVSYSLSKTVTVSKGKYRVKATIKSDSDTITKYSQSAVY